MKPPTVFLGEMTTLEVEAFLKEHHTVIIPVGATEQHGPHGPLLTDVLIPQEVARRAAPRLNAVVAPPVNYALSYPHVGFKGLVYLRIQTFMSMIEDIAAAFGAVGFKRIVFLNGHYDNTYALAYACASAADRLPGGRESVSAQLLGRDASGRRGEYSSLEKGMHANAAETSAILAINPKLVDMDKANAEFPHFPEFTVNSGTGAHGVLLLESAVCLLGDEVGDVGRCAVGEPADRRGLHRGRRGLDDRGHRERRKDLRRDPKAPLRPDGGLSPICGGGGTVPIWRAR